MVVSAGVVVSVDSVVVSVLSVVVAVVSVLVDVVSVVVPGSELVVDVALPVCSTTSVTVGALDVGSASPTEQASPMLPSATPSRRRARRR